MPIYIQQTYCITFSPPFSKVSHIKKLILVYFSNYFPKLKICLYSNQIPQNDAMWFSLLLWFWKTIKTSNGHINYCNQMTVRLATVPVYLNNKSFPLSYCNLENVYLDCQHQTLLNKMSSFGITLPLILNN